MKIFTELIARNIVNLEEIDEFLESFLDFEDQSIEIHNWINGPLKYYLKNKYEEVKLVKKAKKSDPDWLKKGIEEGTALFIDLTHPDLTRKINHCIDYFKSLEERELKKIHKLTFEVAVTKSEEWTKQLQKNAPIEIDESGESVIRKYKNGVTWKRLLTKESLQKEGSKSRMDHCVGGKDFIYKLEKNKAEFYSLRDKNDKPQCTIEVERNSIEQMKGINDNEVKENFTKYCFDFIKKPINRTKYSKVKDLNLINGIKINGDYLDITKLPDNLVVDDLLDLNKFKITSLPNNLTINGDLILTRTNIISLPKNLTVHGDLSLDNLKISELPEDLIVDGELRLNGTMVEQIPKNMKVKSINFRDSCLKQLPENFVCDGNLTLSHIEDFHELPNNLTVNGDLDLAYTSIKKLPKKLTVKGSLNLQGTHIDSLPNNLTINGKLNISYTKIEKLPENLTVNGDLDITGTNIKKLPKTLKMGSRFNYDEEIKSYLKHLGYDSIDELEKSDIALSHIGVIYKDEDQKIDIPTSLKERVINNIEDEY